MLEVQLVRELGEHPTSQDISRLVRRIQGAWGQFTNADTRTLIDLVHTLFDRAQTDQAPHGKDLVWQSSAALGLLLDHPAKQLPLLRPAVLDYFELVSAWCDQEWTEARTG